MSQPDDLLLEVHTEELPPKTLTTLGKTLQQEMTSRLQKANLTFGEAKFYVAPRRLALLIKDVQAEQAAQTVERKGPALSAAYDKDGKPTPACLGFARSCGIEPSALITLKQGNNEWVGFRDTVPGKSTIDLIPEMAQQSLAALPIPKRMRWGDSTDTFIRPVHGIVLLFGKNIIETTILGLKTNRLTYGHRFHHPEAIKISQAQDYAEILEKKGHVIVDFEKRKTQIREQAEQVVKTTLGNDAKILFQESLLNEVTGLVEWPRAICGQFDPRFLNIPMPVLISAMQDHQRYFPIVNKAGKLLPHFAAIINIESADLPRVIAGNERVLRARLSDAAFFFETDKKMRLEERVDALKGIVFQAKLGTLYDKVQRIIQLVSDSRALASVTNVATTITDKAPATLANTHTPDSVTRAALLAKADLTTAMVGEFPELQGVMGYYYATHDGESADVAQAIMDHYKPRFSGDTLPETTLGCIIALADRVDTLVGVFGANQIPTGDKDPYGLRRAALGVLRILIEKQMDLDLLPLLNCAATNYSHLENKEVVPQVLRFMQDRLKAWYQEQGITPDVFAAVAALNLTRPYDMHRRMQAVQFFKTLPDAESLATANKRVSNILSQCASEISAKTIDPKLFEDNAERELAHRIEEQSKRIAPLYQSASYVDVLSELASLRNPVDNFFEHVMVMADNPQTRENRLLMLSHLRALFLQVADIALLVN